MTDTPYIFWDTPTEKKNALKQTTENIHSYDGIMSSTASRRSYLDIEPNISVRSDYLKDDYYRFRPSEDPGVDDQRVIRMCMGAYDKVGIIKNVIDLMGNFASQGITIHHENKSIERFYRKWWRKVTGAERSERFLNLLYRCGNVIIYKRYGKLTKTVQKYMSKAGEIPISKPKTIKKEIPFCYDFLNPLSLEVIGGYAGAFSGTPLYRMQLSQQLRQSFKMMENKQLYDTLPDYIRQAIESNHQFVDLDSNRVLTFFYKKDDWSMWGKPLIHAVLDDVIMLEKMKLADMSALDGAISNIRVWTLGSLEHKILPTRASIDKLRNVLASNVGGGTMDLVWGPEINFTESNTQIYKFLGDEKYKPVYTSIYGGIGIPPTLTGAAGQGSGYTNNFISLKTLIEQLEYGRDLLSRFWMNEIEEVQRAMGFAKPAVIHFDHMILADESAEKNLLLQLADRNIVSMETIRERLNLDNNIEDSRVKREDKLRDKGKIPRKADPYHNGEIDTEYLKIALQKGEVGIQDIVDIDPKHATMDQEAQNPGKERKVEDKGGRPKFSQDKQGRKQKTVLPKSKPSKGMASISIWATEAQRAISECLNPAILNHYGKKNLRELSKAQMQELEQIKFKLLCKLQPYEDFSPEKLKNIMEGGLDLTPANKSTLSSLLADFTHKNGRAPNIDELRQIYNLTYSFGFSIEK